MKLRLKIDDETFEVEVGDLNARPILASVAGETFEVWPEEALAAAAPVVVAAPKAAPAPVVRQVAPQAAGDRSKAVTAPIPGTIVAISVKEGDSVKSGQDLLILEAMKMKNTIRATRAGSIARILVSSGDRVSQGQPLVEFTD